MSVPLTRLGVSSGKDLRPWRMEQQKRPSNSSSSPRSAWVLLIPFPRLLFPDVHIDPHVHCFTPFCSPSRLVIIHLVLHRSFTPIFCSNHRNARLKLLHWIEFQFPERITVNLWEEMDMWQRADVWSRLIGDFFTLKLKIDCFLPRISIPRFRTGQELEKWSTEEK